MWPPKEDFPIPSPEDYKNAILCAIVAILVVGAAATCSVSFLALIYAGLTENIGLAKVALLFAIVSAFIAWWIFELVA